MKKICTVAFGLLLAAAILPISAKTTAAIDVQPPTEESNAVPVLSVSKPTSLINVELSIAYRGPPALCAKLAYMCDHGNQNACTQYDRICDIGG